MFGKSPWDLMSTDMEPDFNFIKGTVTPKLLGIEVYVSELAVNRSWIFPKERFLEYDKSDEWWCRKYGVGHEGPAEPAIFKVGNMMLVHPKIYDELKAVLPEPSKLDGMPMLMPPRYLINSCFL